MAALLRVFVIVLLAISVRASEFHLQWQGTRQWAGPEVWTNPLYDWRVEDDELVALAAANRKAHQIVHRVEHPEAGFQLGTRLVLSAAKQAGKQGSAWAGFSVGLQGLMDSPRHVLVGAKRSVDAGVSSSGVIFVGARKSQEKLDASQPIELELNARDGSLTLRATQQGRVVTVSQPMAPERLRGNIALAAHAINQQASNRTGAARFAYWSGSGEGLVARPELLFGPILWSQYTRQGDQIKLLAQMAPIGAEDDPTVQLEIRDGDAWRSIGEASIEPLSRTAIFHAMIPEGRVDYRVRYSWLGDDYFWSGSFAEDPEKLGEPLRMAVFSCDHGYAFPLQRLVRNVAIQNPHLLFFAGDQIYENFGGFRLVRKPVEKAMLDYLRKYYQFGWTWRDLLKDRPSIIIPDDHDVFQGNIWGAGGRPTKDDGRGGYIMPPDWVNAVQRTQTGHLPDPVDPTPIEQGITVYYTNMKWGGVPIAIIEDRKWKSGFREMLQSLGKRRLQPADVDQPGLQLLGPRQEAFLRQWSEDTKDAPVRFILSQTIFCKGNTHSGPELRKTGLVYDTNSWPQSGRRRALEPFRDGHTIMLHGDQHLGLLVRQGLDRFDDGPYAFMVPGASNGWPRAWWPDSGEITGPVTDAFGNRFTVLAAANPEKGTNKLNPRKDDPPEQTAHRKGSGYGVLRVAPDRQSVTFEMWRYLFDAAQPRPEDQFEGFPVTVDLN